MSLYFLNFDPTCWNTDAIESNMLVQHLQDQNVGLVFPGLYCTHIPMNFLSFVLVVCWFHLVSGGSRSSQLAPRLSMYDYEAQIKSRALPFKKQSRGNLK